ncbi:hypothetical protein, partial [Jiangella asiatica]|uniref:hypothetical protein n=1 Tax=Jiangella asiatica TaxID=2530372 RepID=UPI00193CB711
SRIAGAPSLHLVPIDDLLTSQPFQFVSRIAGTSFAARTVATSSHRHVQLLSRITRTSSGLRRCSPTISVRLSRSSSCHASPAPPLFTSCPSTIS